MKQSTHPFMLHLPNPTRPRRARVFLVVLVIAVLTSITGCRITPQQAGGGEIVIGHQGPIDTFDPLRFPLDADSEFLRLTYDTLVARGPDGHIYPLLAAGWRISDNGMAIEFELRDGVAFHDGTPVVAADVKATLDRWLAEPEHPLRWKLGSLESVAADGDFRVTLNFIRPFPAIWEALANPRFGVVNSIKLEELGEGFGQEPDGSGPFAFKERSSHQWTFQRHSAYKWSPGFYQSPGPALLEEIRLRAIEGGSQELVEALRLGKIDIARFEPPAVDQLTEEEPSVGVSLTAVKDVVSDVGAHLHTFTGTGLVYLGMQTMSEQTEVIDVRRAVFAALDRSELAKVYPGNWGMPAASVLPASFFPQVPRHDAEGNVTAPVRGGTGQQELARQILRDAGFVDTDGDGIRDRGGLPLVVQLYVSDRGVWPELARGVSSQLAQVGIGVELKVVEPRILFGSTADGVAEAFLLGYQWPTPEVLFPLFHSSRTGSTNRTHLSSDSIDRLLESALVTVEPGDRLALYRALEEELADIAPIVPLFHPAGVVVSSGRLTGVLVGPGGEIYPLEASTSGSREK